MMIQKVAAIATTVFSLKKKQKRKKKQFVFVAYHHPAYGTTKAPKGGTPLDAIYVRKEAKEHGSRRPFEGGTRLAAGARIALLEDVITTGGSTLKALAKLREAGFVVPVVVVLVDRLEGGREALENAGLLVRAIYTRNDIAAG